LSEPPSCSAPIKFLDRATLSFITDFNLRAKTD
jgi:hypothetical protein